MTLQPLQRGKTPPATNYVFWVGHFIICRRVRLPPLYVRPVHDTKLYLLLRLPVWSISGVGVKYFFIVTSLRSILTLSGSTCIQGTIYGSNRFIWKLLSLHQEYLKLYNWELFFVLWILDTILQRAKELLLLLLLLFAIFSQKR